MEDIKDLQYFSLKKLKKFVKQIENDKKALKEITALILGKDKTLSMRASWALSHVSFSSPQNIYPLLPQLLKFLQSTDQHSGAIRNVIRIFMEIHIPEKYCGPLFDICLAHAKNATLPHAVRVFSIYVLGKICQRYPELKTEVEIVLNELKTYPQPPSMNACIRKTTKILNKV
jgi:hypothetical protein